MEIFSGAEAIVSGIILLFYFGISCYVILKGSRYLYLPSEKKKKKNKD